MMDEKGQERYREARGVGEPVEYRRVRFLKKVKSGTEAPVCATVALVLALTTCVWPGAVMGVMSYLFGMRAYRWGVTDALVVVHPGACLFLAVWSLIRAKPRERAYVAVVAGMAIVMSVLLFVAMMCVRFPHPN